MYDMAKAILNYHHSLTKQELRDILSAEFCDLGYEVRTSEKENGADLYVIKSKWVGVSIRLKQELKGEYLYINGFTPFFKLQFSLGSLFPFLSCHQQQKSFEEQLKQYVESENFGSKEADFQHTCHYELCEMEI